jgi:hypothetical protein
MPADPDVINSRAWLQSFLCHAPAAPLPPFCNAAFEPVSANRTASKNRGVSFYTPVALALKKDSWFLVLILCGLRFPKVPNLEPQRLMQKSCSGAVAFGNPRLFQSARLVFPVYRLAPKQTPLPIVSSYRDRLLKPSSPDFNPFRTTSPRLLTAPSKE